ncbi:MAG TPA: mechanosensitive ion channel family protein [Euryarchaeota archaeon]|nr:mechanosensitive ion channel family protein [Euryarchaeota archaeon]
MCTPPEIPVSVAILVGTLAAAVVVRILLRRILQPLTGVTRTELDDSIVTAVQNPAFWLVVVFGTSLALRNAFPEYGGYITTAAEILAIALVGKAVKNIVSDVLFGKSIELFDENTRKRLRSVKGMVDAVIYVAVVLMALSAAGIDVWPILAPLGITGVALGFAVKDVATNYVAGVILAVDRDFTAGKKITIKEKGITGVIENVGWRNTYLRTDSGNRVSVPNSTVLNAVIIEEDALDER